MKKTNSLLFSSVIFLYFSLVDLPKFNIVYNGLALLLSIVCIIIFFITKNKKRSN